MRISFGRSALAPAAVVTVAMVLATACAAGQGVPRPTLASTTVAPITPTPQATTPSATPSPTPAATAPPFPYSDEAVAVEPGTYRIPSSAWSVADFTMTLPDGWKIQYGHRYADSNEDVSFYAVVVDAIYADACKGSNGEFMEVGRSVHDLADALLQQPGPEANGPIDTTLGGYPAVRIDLKVPQGTNLEACNAPLGLQIWFSPPADKYLLLTPDEIASVYILDVDGQRQVFLTEQVSATTDEEAELQAVLDSIDIEP